MHITKNEHNAQNFEDVEENKSNPIESMCANNYIQPISSLAICSFEIAQGLRTTILYMYLADL
jgi:hypothetical protein